MSGLAYMVRQMLAITPAEPTPVSRYNPRPPGVMHEGSATVLALAFLRANPRRSFQFCEIVRATGRSDKSIGFGLLYLRSRGLIECHPDARNSRYWLYRAKGVQDV